MNRSEKNKFVSDIQDEFNKSSTVIVANYSGLNVKEIEELRKAMRDNGAKFKVIKNSLTKIALANTKIKSITELFNGPTAVAYSSDPIASAKIAVKYAKKFNKFKIIGGAFENEKIDEEKISFLASLLSLEAIRSQLVGLLNAPAQKMASVLVASAGQLTRLINTKTQELGNSK